MKKREQILLVTTLMTVFAAGTTGAAEFKWNAAAAGNASAKANWLEGGAAASRLPGSDDDIVLDGTSVQNMTWNGGANTGDGVLTATVGSWTQAAGYSGTVTVSTVYSGTFTEFTVDGDCVISNGVWTHQANAGTQTYRLHATVNGSLTLGASAAIHGDGKGISTGGGSLGANHGGFGGGNFSGTTYGDIREPIDLGLPSNQGPGGGAIRLTVTGEARIDGRISVNAPTTNHRSGSGGSVNLRVGTLTGGGTGSIQARGGDATIWYAGGGGRVAVRQTGASSFSSVAIDAAGGAAAAAAQGWYRNHGMAGTVYLQGSSHSAGQGQLIVDNIGRRENQSPIYTQVTSGYDYRVFASIVVKRGGRLGIGSADTFDFSQDRVSGDVSTNATVTVRSNAGVTYPASFMLNDNYTLELAVPTVMSGSLTVASGSAVSHPYNRTAQTYVLDLTVNGALNVQSGGFIDVSDRGFDAAYGPGYTAGVGASHGGQGASATSGKCYGSIFAPTNIGSGGSHSREVYGAGAGGGAIKLTVGGATTVDGSILARGGDQSFRIGSGGSIYLRAASLSGGGTLDSRGANAAVWNAGGGGRVAVILTGSDTFGATPTLVARGGSGTSTAYTAAGGTVYTQGQSDAPGAGLCVVDFGNLTTGDFMLLPPNYTGDMLYQFNDDLTETAFRMQNKARVKLTANVTARAFTINSGSALDLNGFTLAVEELTVAGVSKPNGTYYDADFSEVTGSGQIVVFRPPQGTMISIR